MIQYRRAWRYLPLIVLALAAVSLACVAVPMYVSWPFRHQGATELSVALFVQQMGPTVSVCCVVLAVAFAAAGWRGTTGRKARFTTGFALLLVIAGASLARLNVYELLMFHPLGTPQFFTANEAHLDNDDMLIAVRVNGVARAYPIREMAYHHVVNDTVAGEPIVATY